MYWVLLSKLSATLCWTVLNGQWIPLTKGNLILALWFASSSWKEQTMEWSCINLQWCWPSLCLHPAALKVWTESEGRTGLPGLWVPGLLPSPTIPNTWVSLHPVLCLWMNPGPCKELCAGKALVPPQSHSFRRMFLLNIQQTTTFLFCWTKYKQCYLLLEESLCYSRPTVPQCTQTVILRCKTITLVQDRRHDKQVEIFA